MDQLRERFEKAHQIIEELCQGKRQWTMSIPARPEEDPDIVLASVLDDARATIAAQAERIAALEAEKSELAQVLGMLTTLVPTFDCSGPYYLAFGHRLFDALKAKIAQAKRIGAAEELERMAEYTKAKACTQGASSYTVARNGCFAEISIELRNRAAALRVGKAQ